MNENNPPAFPSHESMGEVIQEGMTLRDWFAGHALSTADAQMSVIPKGLTSAEATALRAYVIADAMLKQRLENE